MTAYTKYEGSLADAIQLYKDFYKDAPFTFVSEKEIHLKQVVNTNKCFLHLHKEDGMLLITSIIDNLTKGASGQAVENMNLHLWTGADRRVGVEGELFLGPLTPEGGTLIWRQTCQVFKT